MAWPQCLCNILFALWQKWQNAERGEQLKKKISAFAQSPYIWCRYSILLLYWLIDYILLTRSVSVDRCLEVVCARAYRIHTLLVSFYRQQHLIETLWQYSCRHNNLSIWLCTAQSSQWDRSSIVCTYWISAQQWVHGCSFAWVTPRAQKWVFSVYTRRVNLWPSASTHFLLDKRQ